MTRKTDNMSINASLDKMVCTGSTRTMVISNIEKGCMIDRIFDLKNGFVGRKTGSGLCLCDWWCLRRTDRFNDKGYWYGLGKDFQQVQNNKGE